MLQDDFLLPSALLTAIRQNCAEKTAPWADITRIHCLGGGSISRAFVLESRRDKIFVKVNAAERVEMFAAEADGLTALAACPTLCVPRVIGYGSQDEHAYLILEHLDLLPLRHAADSAAAGRALAALHGMSGSAFGWQRDNFIGSTPQYNTQHATWAAFFNSQRLQPQLTLAKQRGATTRLLERGLQLAERLDELFADHRPAASLLHGDLWYGNAAVDSKRRLVLFDPAVYFGDREADLAMCELFGGFSDEFFAAYRQALPLPSGYARRKTLYQLYHVLNHFNLFAGGYHGQAERMIDKLLADVAA